MEAVKIEYTVRANYIEQNKQNIKLIMAELERNPIKGVDYKAYNVEGTGVFIHLNIVENESDLKKVQNLQIFQFFQDQLKGSEPVLAPKVERLNII